jgi:hypothetical protein
MDPKFSDMVVPSLWENDNEQFDEDEYELKQLKKQIDEENKEQIKEYDDSKNLLMAICKDMKNQNPEIGNELNKLINELHVNSDIVDKIQKGGKRDGIRLSEVEHNHVSIQGRFTKEQIKQRLEKFIKVSIDELFELPKGMWVRYFIKAEDGSRGLYRTGGFVIHHDPEKRYVTLIAHHNDHTPQRKSFTWNIQIDTVHSVYAMKNNVRKYRLEKLDKKYHLLKGSTNMFNKFMELDPAKLTLFNAKDKNMVYVIYDRVEHALHTPVRKLTNSTLLKSLGITKKEIMAKIKLGIIGQLETPIKGMYIGSIMDKRDIPKLKKLKSRIK